MSQEHLGLFDTPPSRNEIRLAAAIAGGLLGLALVFLSLHERDLGEVGAFVPTINAVMFVAELIIATLLYAQASVLRSRALTILASGYVVAALLLVPHALTFPGAFAPDGLLGAGLNTTGWIAIVRRTIFPTAVIFYALLSMTDRAAQPGTGRPPQRILAWVFAASALAAATTLLATAGHDVLPPLFADRRDGLAASLLAVNVVTITLSITGITLLLRKPKSVLDIWLLVALFAWLVQTLLNLSIHARFTVGFYGLFVIMLLSSLIVMLVLLAESTRLHMRLALATAARNREREGRLMAMDAVVAAISHEVGQPLSAVTTNARAALNWLTRSKPNPKMAIQGLLATMEAGHRSFDVINSMSATFAKEADSSTEFSLNALVRETWSLLDREVTGHKVSLQLALDDSLPPIHGDRVEMQRVLLNLFSNAIESLSATRGRARRVTVRSARLDGQGALLEVSDTGQGIPAEVLSHIFDPFFTTKSTGTGIGLSLCRNIIEKHGGRIWASRGEARGATFHIQLPSTRFASAEEAATA